MGTETTTHTPALRRRARADDRPARPRRRRCGAQRWLRGLRPRGRARGSRACADHQVQALVRRGGHARAARAEPGAHRARGAAPGCALAGAPLRAPAEREGGPGARRARPPGPLRGPPGRADPARRGAAALPQQARVLLRRGRGGRAGARLPPARALRPDRRREPRRAGLRARGRAARGREGVVSRGGPVDLGPARPAGSAAQPRGARGPAHRPAPGARGHEPGLELPGGRAGRAGALRELPLDPRRRAWPRPPARARPRW